MCFIWILFFILIRMFFVYIKYDVFEIKDIKKNIVIRFVILIIIWNFVYLFKNKIRN